MTQSSAEEEPPIYVSFARDDRDVAEVIGSTLGRETILLKRRDFGSEAAWKNAATAAIRVSALVVFVLSPRSVKSRVCAMELAIATEHGVPLFSAPPLARVLYRSTEIGGEIPARLYTAVAQVLAYIYQLNETLRPGQKRPEPPVPEVDEDDFPGHSG